MSIERIGTPICPPAYLGSKGEFHDAFSELEAATLLSARAHLAHLTRRDVTKAHALGKLCEYRSDLDAHVGVPGVADNHHDPARARKESMALFQDEL